MWPYEVPENWVWVKLGSVIELISGRDVATSLCNSDGTGIPYILGASNLDSDGFTVERWIENPVVVSRCGDVLLSVKGTIGKVYLQEEKEINISRQIMALRTLPVVETLFLRDFILHISDMLKEAGNGLIPGISREIILNYASPLPPLPEQHRIVARIESLFAKLDRAKELAQAALDRFETRKAAILHQAFTGALTAQWREKCGVNLDSWAEKALVSVYKFIDYRGKTPIKIDFGIPLVTAKNVKKGYIDYSISEFISAEEHGQRQSRGTPLKGDILFTTEAPLGNVALADLDNYAVAQRLICLQAKNTAEVSNPFVMYYMQTGMFQDKLSEQKTGSTVAGIKAAKLKLLTILTPTLPEQQEIVRLLDSLLEKEQRARELCEDVIGQVDLMKKAILARAFRGELGTGDVGDESAVGLLEDVGDHSGWRRI